MSNPGPLSFTEIVQLCGNRLGKHDVRCPVCGPSRESKGTAKRQVLRIYWDKPDYATYNCARCAIKGFARSGGNAVPIDYVAIAKAKAAAQKRQTHEDGKRSQTASWLWSLSQPAAGTVVEAYLRKRTGLKTNPLATLRYLPPAPPRHPWPGMIAAFGIPEEPEPGILSISNDAVRAVHITYLLPDGSWKAPVSPDKRMFGLARGWPIVLFPASDNLALLGAEGIETALSARVDSGFGVWAAGSASNMAGLADQIPSHIEVLHVVRDHDEAGIRGADALLRAAAARGIEALLYTPEMHR